MCVDCVAEGVSSAEVVVKAAGVVVSIHSLAEGVVENNEPEVVVSLEGVIVGVSLNSSVVVGSVENSVAAVVSIEVENSGVSVVIVDPVEGVCDIMFSVVTAIVSKSGMVDVVSENGV